MTLHEFGGTACVVGAFISMMAAVFCVVEKFSRYRTIKHPWIAATAWLGMTALQLWLAFQ